MDLLSFIISDRAIEGIFIKIASPKVSKTHNLSRKIPCLRAEVIMFASYYI
jgi:hypothetical protein